MEIHASLHHHQQQLSRNRDGRWGTADDFLTSFLHFFHLFSSAFWDFASSRPVHSLMLSSLITARNPAFRPLRAHRLVVDVLDKNQPSLPTLLILVLCLLLSLWPFQLYFIPSILPTTLRFLTLCFWSHFCLIGPFN